MESNKYKYLTKEKIKEFIKRREYLNKESFYWWIKGFTYALSLSDTITYEECEEIRKEFGIND